VQRVDIGHVEVIAGEDMRATVYVELAYLLRDGRQILDTAPYVQLRRDAPGSEWLFWDKGENP
jgi:hypothetical protein